MPAFAFTMLAETAANSDEQERWWLAAKSGPSVAWRTEYVAATLAVLRR